MEGYVIAFLLGMVMMEIIDRLLQPPQNYF
jgi:hypothetical protein